MKLRLKELYDLILEVKRLQRNLLLLPEFSSEVGWACQTPFEGRKRRKDDVGGGEGRIEERRRDWIMCMYKC